MGRASLTWLAAPVASSAEICILVIGLLDIFGIFEKEMVTWEEPEEEVKENVINLIKIKEVWEAEASTEEELGSVQRELRSVQRKLRRRRGLGETFHGWAHPPPAPRSASSSSLTPSSFSSFSSPPA